MLNLRYTHALFGVLIGVLNLIMSLLVIGLFPYPNSNHGSIPLFHTYRELLDSCRGIIFKWIISQVKILVRPYLCYNY